MTTNKSLPSSFVEADLDDIMEKLTTDEAISLISGHKAWWTAAVPRLGVPSIKVSDGPNGVRGQYLFNGSPANCIPCSTALAATWDTALIKEVAQRLMAPETKRRAASVLLAPTCNIQRSPLGGRSFESFSEDPHLSGMMSAAYINGLQSGGVAACIKHFVANDQEHERNGVDSIVSDRALREVYLYPFMLAQKLSNPICYMTSYNKLNGTHCSETRGLLDGILRDEWKSDAMIMSDWFGVYSLTESINAGLDLEMPGIEVWRTHEKVHRSISAHKVTPRTVKERARKVLEMVKKVCKTNSEVIDGDGVETWQRSTEESELMRKVAADSIVLLRNEGDILPLRAEAMKKIAVIGPNAKARTPSGGGSASMRCSYVITPYEGIISALPKGVEVNYLPGCTGYKSLPVLDDQLTTTDGGTPGWTGSFYCHNDDSSGEHRAEPIKVVDLVQTHLFFFDALPEGITRRWSFELKGRSLLRAKDTQFQFGLTVMGRAKLFVDGEVVIDNWTRQARAPAFYGMGTPEVKGEVLLRAGQTHEILLQFQNVYGPAPGDEAESFVGSQRGGITLGGAEVLHEDQSIAEAAQLARDSDVAVVIVGLNADWETEGVDRDSLELPGRTNDLVREVVKANKKTVVVCQSGSAVTMPWADDVAGLVHAWYGGNENGNAIADILFGTVVPSGKMPMTFPERLEDVPSYGHFGSENGKVRYAEDLHVGYKGYEHRKIKPLFPFGFGLSYTTFKFNHVSVSKAESLSSPDFFVEVSLSITNTGAVTGSEVVQLYVSLPNACHLTHPTSQLRAFCKIKSVEPGQTRYVTLMLDKYAVSHWDDVVHKWKADKGKYVVRVGASSNKMEGETSFEVEKAFEWSGL